MKTANTTQPFKTYSFIKDGKLKLVKARSRWMAEIQASLYGCDDLSTLVEVKDN